MHASIRKGECFLYDYKKKCKFQQKLLLLYILTKSMKILYTEIYLHHLSNSSRIAHIIQVLLNQLSLIETDFRWSGCKEVGSCRNWIIKYQITRAVSEVSLCVHVWNIKLAKMLAALVPLQVSLHGYLWNICRVWQQCSLIDLPQSKLPVFQWHWKDVTCVLVLSQVQVGVCLWCHRFCSLCR